MALDITNNDRKKALLLHLAGEAVYEIYDGLVIAAVAPDADLAVDNVYIVTKRALDNHFKFSTPNETRNLKNIPSKHRNSNKEKLSTPITLVFDH